MIQRNAAYAEPRTRDFVLETAIYTNIYGCSFLFFEKKECKTKQNNKIRSQLEISKNIESPANFCVFKIVKFHIAL